MRSIGKRNIDKLKAMIDKETANGLHGIALHDKLNAMIPSSWFDIWESAHDEIEGIIWDHSFANRFRNSI